MHIGVTASGRLPAGQPFEGLEAWTRDLLAALDRRGHDVSVVTAQENVGGSAYDVVHASSLLHLPAVLASTPSAAVVTTLHAPPLPGLEPALPLPTRRTRRQPLPRFAAASAHTAAAWSGVVRATVIRNGVDTTTLRPGPGGGPAVWVGRLVREKAPHEAIEAARLAGVELVLAGPVCDAGYVEAEVRPRLGDGCRYAGHLRAEELSELLGSASVAVVTPAWDQPCGRAAAEAMACGTPVAGYARGPLSELVPTHAGELARPGDVASLATAIQLALTCDRAAVRAHAEESCSVERMVDGYERLYASVAHREAA